MGKTMLKTDAAYQIVKNPTAQKEQNETKNCKGPPAIVLLNSKYVGFAKGLSCSSIVSGLLQFLVPFCTDVSFSLLPSAARKK